MNILQFIASVISSLVWPIAVVLIILMLRKPLSQIILSLQKLSYKELQLDFGQEVSRLISAADQAKVPTITVENGSTPREKSFSSSGTFEGNFDAQIVSLAKNAPTAAIIMIWSQVENEIQLAINRLAISVDNPIYNSVLRNIVMLRENNYISEDTEKILEGLRILRNKVVRGEAKEEEITYIQVMEYAQLAKRMIKLLAVIRR